MTESLESKECFCRPSRAVWYGTVWYCPEDHLKIGRNRRQTRYSSRVPSDYVKHAMPLYLVRYSQGRSTFDQPVFHPNGIIELFMSPSLHHTRSGKAVNGSVIDMV